jgi:hypothetical protein
LKPSRGYLAAIAIIVTTSICATVGVWLFHPPATSSGSSVWRLIVSERWTLGFVRLAIVALALYAASSVAALIATGRWIRTLSTAGFESDAPSDADKQLEALEARLRDMENQRDQAFRLLREHLHG